MPPLTARPMIAMAFPPFATSPIIPEITPPIEQTHIMIEKKKAAPMDPPNELVSPSLMIEFAKMAITTARIIKLRTAPPASRSEMRPAVFFFLRLSSPVVFTRCGCFEGISITARSRSPPGTAAAFATALWRTALTPWQASRLSLSCRASTSTGGSPSTSTIFNYSTRSTFCCHHGPPIHQHPMLSTHPINRKGLVLTDESGHIVRLTINLMRGHTRK